jgi:RNA polymerase sigma-70 factor (ECF subfamily)
MEDAAVDLAIDAVFRREAGRVLGTLIRLLGDFELAEESLQDAERRARKSARVAGARRAPQGD